MNSLFLGNCLDILRDLPDNSFDALVVDPPAGVGFMSEKWDTPEYFPLQDRGERLTGSGHPTASRGVTFDDSKKGRTAFIAFMTEVMSEVLRVLIPGAHGLVWALPRTSYWTAMSLDDAGFEIRDCLYHHFGSGFPKSHNVSKAIDKRLGKTREVIGQGKYAARKPHAYNGGTSLQISKNDPRVGHPLTLPASSEAEQWDGWGTALKPSTECWWLVRKPLTEKTVAAQMLATGTGALNIDACRVPTSDILTGSGGAILRFGGQNTRPYQEGFIPGGISQHENGRWPSHLLLSHSIFCIEGECDASCPIPLMDSQSGISSSQKGKRPASYGATPGVHEGWRRPSHASYQEKPDAGYEDKGGASRFFQQFHPLDEVETPFLYCAKSSSSERNLGCTNLPDQMSHRYGEQQADEQHEPSVARPEKNSHPTPKSIRLMSWLCRLVTPPGGTILDPFCGSGSTGVAAIHEGFHFLGIEQSPEYFAIAQARIAYAQSSLR